MKKNRILRAFALISAMTIAVAAVIFFTQKQKPTANQQPTEYVFTARVEADSK